MIILLGINTIAAAKTCGPASINSIRNYIKHFLLTIIVRFI